MRKGILALAIAASAVTGPAMAACEYAGVSYEVGAVVCFDGYLQECTPAQYWKAIGYCRAADPQPRAAMSDSEEATAVLVSLPAMSFAAAGAIESAED